MKKPTIYLLYQCDQWKNTDSQRVCCATTSTFKLRRAIEKHIIKGYMLYGTNPQATKESQIEALRMDYKKFSTGIEMNMYLTYGLIQEFEDGEMEM